MIEECHACRTRNLYTFYCGVAFLGIAALLSLIFYTEIERKIRRDIESEIYERFDISIRKSNS